MISSMGDQALFALKRIINTTAYPWEFILLLGLTGLASGVQSDGKVVGGVSPDPK
jgi:hypothetical protein